MFWYEVTGNNITDLTFYINAIQLHDGKLSQITISNIKQTNLSRTSDNKNNSDLSIHTHHLVCKYNLITYMPYLLGVLPRAYNYKEMRRLSNSDRLSKHVRTT